MERNVARCHTWCRGATEKRKDDRLYWIRPYCTSIDDRQLCTNHATPPIPMGTVIANELEIIGSHGMQAHQYPAMLDLIFTKKIPLEKMIGQRMNLADGAQALMNMNQFKNTGVMIINPSL